MFRFYNGELFENSLDAFANLLIVSPVLGNDFKKEFFDLSNVLDFSFETLYREFKDVAESYETTILDDICHIFKNKFLIVEIFYKMYDFIHEGNEKKNLGLNLTSLI